MSRKGLSDGRVLLARDRFRVVMGDTDAARVIYFGAPLRWSERLMTTWFADIGLPTSHTIDHGGGYPAVHTEVVYRAPLRLDDEVFATLWVDQVANSSLIFHSQFTTDPGAAPAVEMWLTKVHVRSDEDGLQAVPLDPSLLAVLGDLRVEQHAC